MSFPGHCLSRAREREPANAEKQIGSEPDQEKSQHARIRKGTVRGADRVREVIPDRIAFDVVEK